MKWSISRTKQSGNILLVSPKQWVGVEIFKPYFKQLFLLETFEFVRMDERPLCNTFCHRESVYCLYYYNICTMFNIYYIIYCNYIQYMKELWCSLAVFNQGDEGKSWYIILQGSVDVVIYGKVSTHTRTHTLHVSKRLKILIAQCS